MTIVIPLLELSAQYAQIKSEVDAAIARVVRSGRYVLGPEVEAFEREFAKVCASQHAVGVNSGTSALYLSLLAAGVGPGNEVITVPFTFKATVSAICATGARVRLVDIDPDSLTMDPGAFERQISERTKAVIPVHLFGHPADMDPIRNVARQHELTVIEDACQAHGATYHDQPVGSLGHLGCFSFYPSKNLGTFGEGGIIVTNDPALADTARQLRSWGPEPGAGNYRLSAIQAAVLRVKLPHLQAWNGRRRAIAARYGDLLGDCGIRLPGVMPYAAHVFHIYAIRATRRDALAHGLQARGIEVAVHYERPVHLLEQYAHLGYTQGAFPVAEQAAREELSLPIYPEMPDASIVTVAEAIREESGRQTLVS